MSIEIVTCPDGRWAELMGVLETVFGETFSPEMTARFERVVDKTRFPTVFDHDRIVAASGVLTFRMTVPGGEVDTGGVTAVGVLPSHRRRGIMSAMMRRMIDDCHERGEPVAVLWASEATIYQRFGYGLATVAHNLEADTRSGAFTRDWKREGSFRMLRQEEAREIVAPIYEAARRGRPGFLSRSPDWWIGVLEDDDKKKGGEAKRIVVYETDDGPEAYAVYRTKGEWDARGTTSVLTVGEAIGSTVRGTREIWRYLLDVDLMRTLKAYRLPADHPLFMLVAEPRRLGATVGDGVWLRIVDVKSALEGRTYGIDGHGEGALTFDLSDDFCEWNAGRWTLTVSDGRAKLARSKAEADLALNANDLGSLYLGGFVPSALARAGRITELRPGALATADRLLPASIQPWCPEEF
jgi:predicted acetyltransferase